MYNPRPSAATSLTCVYLLCEVRLGLESDQVRVLKKCFDGFADKAGAIATDTVGSILNMMAWKVGQTSTLEKSSFTEAKSSLL